MNNREILFRGKRVDNEEWVEGDLRQDKDLNTVYILGWNYSVDEGGLQREAFEYMVKPETVGQYTGLTDKKGTKIFEGDILRGDIPSCLQKSQNCIGFVRYGESAFLIDFCKSREPWETQKVGFCSFWNYEVLGNICDNPELLKNKEGI